MPELNVSNPFTNAFLNATETERTGPFIDAARRAEEQGLTGTGAIVRPGASGSLTGSTEGFNLAAAAANEGVSVTQYLENNGLTINDVFGDTDSSGNPRQLNESFASIDDLIESRTPESLDILSRGSSQALQLSEQGRASAVSALQPFGGLEAFEQQQQILGNRGQAAQQQAIGGIPVSQFDQELQRRQQVGQLRQASARGELNSGATLLAAQQLRGGQQADVIARRLGQLEPLAAAARGVRTGISGIEQAEAARQAQQIQGLGNQQANIRLGATAPLIQAGIDRAEISGLRGISSANRNSQVAEQLAGLAGRFIPQQSAPATQAPATIQPAFSEAGQIGVA
jgi:hypothetical protein